MSFHGGLLPGASRHVFLLSWRSFWNVTDFFSSAMSNWFRLGRLGNFINVELRRVSELGLASDILVKVAH